MTDNLDELKRKWQQLSARVEQLEETNLRLTECLARSKVSTLQEKLAGRIRRWGYIGLAFPFLAPSLSMILHLPWWYSMLYALLGLVATVNSYMFSSFIMEERLAEMPVAKAIERAVKIKLRQQRIIIAGMIISVALVGLGAFLLPESEELEDVLIGGAVGGAIGLCISIPRTVGNIRMAKKMVEWLND